MISLRYHQHISTNINVQNELKLTKYAETDSFPSSQFPLLAR